MTPGKRARPLPAEQRRDSIVRAAVPLVRRQGRAVTTREIALAAGVSEGTLFHVFPDKEAIIAAVVELELRPGRVLAALAAIDPAEDLHQRLVRIVEVLRRRLTGVFELMTALGMHRPPAHERTGPAGAGWAAHGSAGHGPPHREILTVIAEMLSPDADRLRYPPDQTAALIRLVTFAASHPSITDENPLPAPLIADLLLHGITTPPVRDLIGAGTTSVLGEHTC